MALENPINAFLQVALAQNQNRQQAQQDAMGIGQNLGGAMSHIAKAVQEQKKKELLNQIVMAMRNQGQPQQGPQPEGVGMGPGMAPPASGMGAPSPDQSGTIDALMTQYDPQQAIKSHFSNKDQDAWSIVPGMLTEGGNPLQQSKKGQVRTVDLSVKPTGRGNSAFGTITKWEDMPPEMQYLGKQTYEGNIEIEKLGYKEKTQAALAANEYARHHDLPSYQTFTGSVKAGTTKAFGYGKPAMNVLSLNTAIGHAKSALDAFGKVSNTDQRLLNVPLNKARAMTNDPNIIKLQTTLNALSGELATVFKGSAGTDQEIGHWMNALSQDLTPIQAQSAIQQVNELLNSRLSALNQMRSQGTSNRPASGPLLSPHAKELTTQFEKMGKGQVKRIGRFEVQVNP